MENVWKRRSEYVSMEDDTYKRFYASTTKQLYEWEDWAPKQSWVCGSPNAREVNYRELENRLATVVNEVAWVRAASH